MTFKLKAVIALGLAAAMTFAGWMSRGWYEDSVRLAAERSMQRTLDAAMERESKIANVVENRLAELRASERVIDRGVIREIQKPVYERVCLEPELVDLLNKAASGPVEQEE